MLETKYWKKDGTQGGFWSKCKDQVEIADGRVLHKYTKPNPGERWQYVSPALAGKPESMYVDEGKFGDALCIGLQHNAGVDVLQIPVWQKKGVLSTDFKGFAKKLPNLDVTQELVLSTWINAKGARTWKDRSGETRTVIPIYITAQQGGENVKSGFEYKEGEGYIGIPAPEIAELSSGKVYDFTLQNDFFMDLVNKFIADNQYILDETKASRGNTPAEVSAAVRAEVDEDDNLPF